MYIHGGGGGRGFLRKHGEFHIRQSCLMIVKSKFTKNEIYRKKINTYHEISHNILHCMNEYQ